MRMIGVAILIFGAIAFAGENCRLPLEKAQAVAREIAQGRMRLEKMKFDATTNASRTGYQTLARDIDSKYTEALRFIDQAQLDQLIASELINASPTGSHMSEQVARQARMAEEQMVLDRWQFDHEIPASAYKPVAVIWNLDGTSVYTRSWGTSKIGAMLFRTSSVERDPLRAGISFQYINHPFNNVWLVNDNVVGLREDQGEKQFYFMKTTGPANVMGEFFYGEPFDARLTHDEKNVPGALELSSRMGVYRIVKNGFEWLITEKVGVRGTEQGVDQFDLPNFMPLRFNESLHLLVGLQENNVIVYDFKKKEFDLAATHEGVIDAAIDPSGNQLVSISADGSMKFWKRKQDRGGG